MSLRLWGLLIRFSAAFLVGTGIALSGFFLGNGLKNFKSSGTNHVSVKGIAQKIVSADTFSLSISFWEEGEEFQHLTKR